MLRLGKPARRLRIGFLVVAFVVSIFGGRLLQLQGVDAARYALRAMNQRLVTVPLRAERGDITDRSGVRLATTVDTVSVAADPQLTRAHAAEIADLVAPALGVNVIELEQKLKKQKTRFVYLGRHVSPSVWDALQTKLEDRKFSGLWADPDPLRTYPAGPVASNIVGFVSADGKGLAGLEYADNNSLQGRDGWSRYERANGKQIPLGKRAGKDPVPGANLRLTLDRDVQYVAQQAIDETVRRTKAESGDVVVMDAETGDLIAVATSPGFDPNHRDKAKPDDLGNRALQQAYEPGSVEKLVTASALLDGGYVTPQTKISVPTVLHRDGRTIHDYWTHPTIGLTFEGAIAKSSNIGTILAAEKMPMSVQAEYLAKFGLGRPTGIGFPGETKGIVPPVKDWNALRRATIAFGQGLSVNAVQMASVLATIANGGVREQPRLLLGTVDDNGTLKPAPRAKPTRVISERAAKAMTRIMQAVTMPGGIAPKAAIDGYLVAGKTGTAQRVDPGCGCYKGYSASFGGFAPADNPRYVAYVVVHNPKGDHSGGSIAGPVFSKVMSFVLQKYGIPPTGAEYPKARLTW